MTHDTFLALVVFALVSSLTPGPNNLMLMASGANFGARRTIPHMAGVVLGFVAMVVLVGAGLMRLFDAVPETYTILKWVSVAYLLWLAFRIAQAAPAEAAGEDTVEAGRGGGRRPFTFLEAAAFQWVNPKAWAISLTAITVYAPGRELASVLAVAAVFAAISLPSVGSWTIAGQTMRRWLSTPRRLRAFNWTMAALLVASLLPMF